METTENIKKRFLKDFKVPYGITKEPYFQNAITTLGYYKQEYIPNRFQKHHGTESEYFHSLQVQT